MLIPCLERGEKSSKSTSWSQVKLRRHPKRDDWGQQKYPDALISADGRYKLGKVWVGKWSWLEKVEN